MALSCFDPWSVIRRRLVQLCAQFGAKAVFLHSSVITLALAKKKIRDITKCTFFDLTPVSLVMVHLQM